MGIISTKSAYGGKDDEPKCEPDAAASVRMSAETAKVILEQPRVATTEDRCEKTLVWSETGGSRSEKRNSENNFVILLMTPRD
jgi:hypothetical protein